ncbi:hypothetical protein [uncultured Mucilaginibacter sp.]|uniref:hypothetical protein n=1 Tax=uncultured Mucilaginibacter sp. TaxID=797541 RepID=UPI0026363AB6|nr:hypothetical protein [uncultured Mucilaginibacter sp.]
MYNPFVMLFVLAIPVACISWTVTHEEVFKEIREFCVKNSHEQKTLAARKFFYLFTCEYCFSHYITIFMLIITGYKLLFDGWQGYLIAGFSLVWVANIYMSLYGLIRLDIKIEKTEAKVKEKQLEKID